VGAWAEDAFSNVTVNLDHKKLSDNDFKKIGWILQTSFSYSQLMIFTYISIGVIPLLIAIT